MICHGILLAEDGAKLSKKLRNYTEPTEIFQHQGSDALRWYFTSTGILRGGDLRISDAGIDEVVRRILLPSWSAYSFFTLYANVDGHRAGFRTDSEHLLDRYMLAKTQQLVTSVSERMDAYDLPGSTEIIGGFVDALNNWYIRRSRDRFRAPNAAENAADNRDAHDPLSPVPPTLPRAPPPLPPPGP